MMARFIPGFRLAPTLLAVVALLAVAAGAAPRAAAQEAHVPRAQAFVDELTGEAVGFLNSGQVSPQETRRRFQELFNEAFAVRAIAQFVLGRFWNTASPEVRENFVQLFEDVTIRVWSDRFVDFAALGGGGNFFEVVGASAAPSPAAGQKAAVVRTLFKGSSDDIRVDWRVASVNGDEFKITDVIIEGVSLVNTQREEFTSVLRRNDNDVARLNALLRSRLNP